MNSKAIVVLGGGVGGIVLVNALRERIPHEGTITLVEKNLDHTFAPSLLWLMTGGRQSENVVRPLHTLVRPGVRVINAEVTGIDVAAQRIATSTQTLGYDYLVLALGAELAPELVPGLMEEGYSFFALDEAKRLHGALAQFGGGNVSLVVCSLPYKCPGAPHEAAMLIADYFRRRGLRDRVDMHLYTPEAQPMPVAGPQLGEAVKQMLTSKGISFHPLHKLTSVNAQTHELIFEGKDATTFGLLVAVPPHRAPRIIRDSGLSNEAGWVPVDRFTLKTKHENVYAIGDVTAISLPGRWKPDVPMMLPKAGVFAHVQAEIVAERIADEINGRTPKAEFCGTGYCMLEAGEGLAGFAFGDFFGEPSPRLELRNMSRAWHLGKVLFEQWWLAPFGVRKAILHTLLKAGARGLRIPVNV